MAPRKKPEPVDRATRTLPYNIEAEAAVLGAVLLNDTTWPDVVVRVTAGEFFRVAHQHVFEAITAVKARDARADFLTVKDELVRRGVLEEVGSAYLSSLVDGVPRSTNVDHYAAIVREHARLRELVAVGDRVATKAYGLQSSAEIVDDAFASLLGMASIDPHDGVTSLGAEYQRYVVSLDEQAPATISTGYVDLDAQLSGGLRRKELTILAARPSVGKTALMMGIAEHAAASGHPGVVFSLEMPKAELVARSLSFNAKVPLQRLRTRQLAEVELSRISDAMQQAALPLDLEDSANTIAQLDGWIKKLKQRPQGLAVAFIDYLQLMSPPKAMDNREAEVSALSRGLKRLAKSNSVSIVALSQLSRAAESRKDKRPQLSDLRESGALEQDADVALLLFREEMHVKREDNDGLAEVIVAKQRNGPTGVVKLYFHKDYSWFSSLAKQGEVEF